MTTMQLYQFTGRTGCSIPLNLATLVATDFDGEVTTLVGSTVVMEIGSGFGTAPRLVVSSATPPTAPAVFEWTPGAQVSTLKIELSPAQADVLGAGQWTGVIKVLGPTSGQVNHNVPSMTFQLTVERWPAVVE